MYHIKNSPMLRMLQSGNFLVFSTDALNKKAQRKALTIDRP